MDRMPRSDGYYAAAESWLHGEMESEDFRSVIEQQPDRSALDANYDDHVGEIWKLIGAGNVEAAKEKMKLYNLEQHFSEF